MIKQQEIIKKASKSKEDQIDLMALLQLFWNGRKQVVKTVLVFMILGVFIALFSEHEYTASTTIASQSSKKSSGSLSGLAALAGFNLGGVGEEVSIPPKLYPQIINSVSFQKEMIKTPLTIDGQDQKVSYKEYYNNIYTPSLMGRIKKYTIGLPGLLLGLLKSRDNEMSNQQVIETQETIMHFSNQDEQLMNLLKSQLSITINEKEGFIIIAASMSEAKPASELVKRVQELLEAYVIDFKIQKSLAQLDFIKKRFVEKEKEFKRIQEKLAFYSDANQGVNSARAKTELLLLESEYDLAYSVYSELAKQLETQEIKVKEDTPIFTIIDPVFVPLHKTSPNFAMTVLIAMFLGFILIIGRLGLKEPLLNLLEEIKQSS